MTKEKTPVNFKKDEAEKINKKNESKPVKPLRREDVMFVRPTKAMTTDEMVKELDKQGMRPITMDEVLRLEQQSGRIELPEDTTIIDATFEEKKDEEPKQPVKPLPKLLKE